MHTDYRMVGADWLKRAVFALVVSPHLDAKACIAYFLPLLDGPVPEVMQLADDVARLESDPVTRLVFPLPEEKPRA